METEKTNVQEILQDKSLQQQFDNNTAILLAVYFLGTIGYYGKREFMGTTDRIAYNTVCLAFLHEMGILPSSDNIVLLQVAIEASAAMGFGVEPKISLQELTRENGALGTTRLWEVEEGLKGKEKPEEQEGKH